MLIPEQLIEEYNKYTALAGDRMWLMTILDEWKTFNDGMSDRVNDTQRRMK